MTTTMAETIASYAAALTYDDKGNLGLGIDIERPEDKVVEYQGTTLLVVEPAIADTLKNIAIDVEDSGNGMQLVIVDTPG